MAETLSAVDTPAFAIDVSKVKRNVMRMAVKASSLAVQLRPHVKTHKCKEVAYLQTLRHLTKQDMPEGLSVPRVAGIVVSTLAEARYFQQHGYSDILYAVPLSPSKFQTVKHLCSTGNGIVRVLVDCLEGFELLEAFARDNAFTFNAFVKIDTGYHRAGVPAASEEATNLVIRVSKSDCIMLDGLYSHDGHSYDCRSVEEVDKIVTTDCQLMQNLVQSVSEVVDAHTLTISVGSTPSCSRGTQHQFVTEMHPGNYALYDRQQLCAGSCEQGDIAGFVVTSVISHHRDRSTILIDAGALALSKDKSPLDDLWGDVLTLDGHPVKGVALVKISQEEGVLKLTDENDTSAYDRLPIGTRLRILPNHACLTSSCFSHYYLFDGSDGHVTITDTAVPIRHWNVSQ